METKITWTKIDEAPALASYCLLPIVKSFTKGTGIEIETKDMAGQAGESSSLDLIIQPLYHPDRIRFAVVE